MRELTKMMQKNEFFKQFVNKYQKGLNRTLDIGTNEPTENARNSSKSPPPERATQKIDKRTASYNKQIMDHVNNNNYYRKHLPDIFSNQA